MAIHAKHYLFRSRWLAAAITAASLFTGCATQAPPVVVKESPQPTSAQKSAQQVVTLAAPVKPTLKRKIALGRITNETSYGRSLLRDSVGDPLGKQVTDLLSKSLTESGAYLVFERPDISRLKDESNLTGAKLNLVGVDALIVGSLTELARQGNLWVDVDGFCSRRRNSPALHI